MQNKLNKEETYQLCRTKINDLNKDASFTLKLRQYSSALLFLCLEIECTLSVKSFNYLLNLGSSLEKRSGVYVHKNRMKVINALKPSQILCQKKKKQIRENCEIEECILILVKKGEDIFERNSMKLSCVDYLVSNCNYTLLNKILKCYFVRESELRLVKVSKRTPLRYKFIEALNEGDTKKVERILYEELPKQRIGKRKSRRIRSRKIYDRNLDLKTRCNFLHLLALFNNESNLKKEWYQHLIKQGVSSVNQRMICGITVYHLLMLNFQSQADFNIALIKWMIQYKGEAKKVSDGYGNNLLHIYCSLPKIDLKVINFLRTATKVDVLATNKKNQTIFEILLQNNHLSPQVFEYLLSKKILKLNQKYRSNLNLLHLACKQGSVNAQLVKLILQQKIIGINDLCSRGNTCLHYYCRNGNVNPEIVKNLLKRGVDVNLKNDKHKAALHLLCQKQQNPQLQNIQLLLQYGADINIKTADNYNILHYLCSKDHLNFETIEMVLKNGLNINSKTNSGQYAIHFLIENIHRGKLMEIFQTFLNYKVDLNVLDASKQNLLQIVCQKNNPSIEIIKILIKNDNGKWCIGNIGDPPFVAHLKTQTVSIKILQLLIENGADKNYISGDYENYLHIYLKHNEDPSIKIVKYLYKLTNADLNDTTCDGVTVLFFACCKESPSLSIIKYLITKGADPMIFQKGAFTAFHQICRIPNIPVPLFKFLLQKMTNLNLLDNVHRSALHYVCDKPYPSLELIRLLLENNANVDQVDSDYVTPLHLISNSVNPMEDYYKIFIKFGVDLNAIDRNGDTVIHWLCSRINCPLGTVKLLIKNNALCDLKNSTLWSPLHWACNQRAPSIRLLNLLIVNGNQINDKDVKSRSPLYLICSKDNPSYEAIKFLLSNGAKVNGQTYIKKASILHKIIRQIMDFSPFSGYNLKAEKKFY
ncbi:ankyrin repeat ph and sec7 domain containing protein secg-related [Anaeramoeba flamelloides]|uniref:Ankyrin repeat ph and sec7 domain containing protein secg-related n=1 Tax=Anaeramoeba flamelloides TaxID=1746091 RepID=A0AAV7ZPC6_9EUKA|nr:ankyrin repeat ph and sec7 domain containing protein secg-related [Anaeramoeba flamelloides]